MRAVFVGIIVSAGVRRFGEILGQIFVIGVGCVVVVKICSDI